MPRFTFKKGDFMGGVLIDVWEEDDFASSKTVMAT